MCNKELRVSEAAGRDGLYPSILRSRVRLVFGKMLDYYETLHSFNVCSIIDKPSHVFLILFHLYVPFQYGDCPEPEDSMKTHYIYCYLWTAVSINYLSGPFFTTYINKLRISCLNDGNRHKYILTWILVSDSVRTDK